MVKLTFRGLMAPVFTPFNNDREKSLNLSVIPEYAEFLKSRGVEGVLVNGTTGEGVSQTLTERKLTTEAWSAAVQTTGQTLMVQVGGASLADARSLASHAAQHGADALLCLADLFHQPRSAEDLLLYLQQVGEAAPDTPLLYYHIPGFTGIDVNMREMLELAEKGVVKVPTLAGLKFTCNDLSMGASLLDINPDKYAVFLGSDTILAAALCLGMDSAIGTTLNMFPELNHKIVKCMQSSDVIGARRAQKQLSVAVTTIASQGSWVGTMKSAMGALTPIKVGPVRQPLRNLTDSQIKQTITQLKNLEII